VRSTFHAMTLRCLRTPDDRRERRSSPNGFVDGVSEFFPELSPI
jgi:hypothetical protein